MLKAIRRFFAAVARIIAHPKMTEEEKTDFQVW
jgi:hypothetical protein